MYNKTEFKVSSTPAQSQKPTKKKKNIINKPAQICVCGNIGRRNIYTLLSILTTGQYSYSRPPWLSLAGSLG